MRVAFFTNFIPHYRRTFFEKLCRNTPYEWSIIRSAEGEPGRDAYSGAIAVPGTLVTGSHRRIGSFIIRWQRGILHAARRFHPDLVILLGIPGTLSNWALLVWAKASGKKIMIWACGWEPQKPGSVAFRLKRLLAKAYYSVADRFLVYSTKGAAYLEELGVDRDKIRISFNGLDLDGLDERRESILEFARLLRSHLSNGAKLILYVGALIPDKRVNDLLHAFSKVDQSGAPVHLWIVGAGHDRRSLEALSHDLKIDNVRFLGRIGDEIESYFAAADFFVLPGHGGLAFNQAMYWGTPCIASEADGTEDDLVINGSSGFRFELGNRGSLLTALNACIRLSNSERERMGEVARELIVSRSNVNAMVAEFHRSIAEILPRDSADVSRMQLKLG